MAALLISASTLSGAVNALQLGAKLDSPHKQFTFRVYSSNATRMELYLYDQAFGSEELVHVPLKKNSTDSVWSATVPLGSLPASLQQSTVMYYGYRAWGPNWPFTSTWTKGSNDGFLSDVDAQGNRFNPNKLLIDPYAREISHDPVNKSQTDGSIYASGSGHRSLDSGKVAPKSILFPSDNTNTGSKPSRLPKEDVIYEVHLRGLTNNISTLGSGVAGTYKGAASEVTYLKQLGITAVEFLPMQETQNDQNDLQASTNGVNYWGYSTLNYFAPDRHYSSDQTPGGPTREFRQMVKAFHDAGLKVYLDVVYNHTGEGYAYNPSDTSTYNILSWRGLDNPTYYSLTKDLQFSWDNTGTGGNYNTVNPIAQNLIVDSLAYWKDQMGVDGFRFDLASVLGNVCEHGCFQYDKMDGRTALNRLAKEFPQTVLIAEPWIASGDGGYQVGNFPSGWSEWNDKYRDSFRKSQNQLGVETVTLAELAMRFAGSSDLYQNNGRAPWNSLNFMVAHDGFTLADLYRYNTKNNNQPFPFGPSDGGRDANESWDQGGDAKLQRQAARNGLAFLMLSAGTPMMTGGDEFLRSLQGNNNPYNLDASTNWLNYTWDSDQKVFHEFAQRLIAFRASHAALRPATFYTGQQLQWFRPDGGTADTGYFTDTDNHAIAWLLNGKSLGDAASSLYVAYNSWKDEVDFTLPPLAGGLRWFRVTDTSAWNESMDTVCQPGAETLIGAGGTHYGLQGRALAVLIAK